MRFVHNYDSVTGAYTTSSPAFPDPVANPEGLDTGDFIVPAYATLIAPPPPKQNNLVVFKNGKWGYVPQFVEAPPTEEPAPPSPDMVDMERDKRISLGFIFESNFYQARPDDRENISGAKQIATDAVAVGAQPNDFDWQQLLIPSAPDVFEWITSDNRRVAMDAQTVIRLGYTALVHKQLHIVAARAIKDMEIIPDDYADDKYWPSIVS